jgi:hypothetical protein
VPKFDVFSLFGDSELKAKIETARQEAHAEVEAALASFMAAVERGD